MSSSTTKSCCVVCRKETTVLKCEDCWQRVDDDPSITQNQATNKTSAEGTVNEEKTKIQEQVNDWKCQALNQIRQMAEETKALVSKYESNHIYEVIANLAKLTDQLRQCYEENNSIAQKIVQEHEELAAQSQSLLDRENTASTSEEPEVANEALLSIPNIHANAKWTQNGISVAGGNGKGSRLNQIPSPRNIIVENDETICVTDQMNHRIVEWKIGATTGQVIAGGNGQGHRSDQFIYPTAAIIDKGNDSLIISDLGNHRIVTWPRRNGTAGETIISDVHSFGLAIDSYGYLYVCEYDQHVVLRWKIGEKKGTVVAGGNGLGYRLDQLNNPTHIFVDRDRSLYVSDGGNHRVMKWMEGAKEGIVVAGGHGQGTSLKQLSYPRGVIVDQLGTLYVADFTNNRVMRWPEGATEGSLVVGDPEKGARPNQLNGCWDLAFDGQGNLFVSDSNNQRVQKFNIEPNSIQ